MRKDSDPHKWIQHLNLEKALQHLADRNLSSQEMLRVLRARLLRYEEQSLSTAAETPNTMPLDRSPLRESNLLEEGAVSDPKTPLFTSYGEIKVTDPPRGGGVNWNQARPGPLSRTMDHRPLRAPSAEAYNLM